MNTMTMIISDNRKILVVSVVCRWRSLCWYLSLRGWLKSNLRWLINGFERLDIKHNYRIWTKWWWDALIKEKCWPLLWSIAVGPYGVVSDYGSHYLFDKKRLLFFLWIEVKVDDLVVVMVHLIFQIRRGLLSIYFSLQ